jgi:hypothetical protein
VRRVTCNAAFGLQRSMFVCERTLLISVALNAGRVCACSQSRLLQFEASVRIVTVAALHHAFEHLMMKWLGKIRLHLAVTAHAELGLSYFQHIQSRKVRLLSVGCSYKGDRLRNILVIVQIVWGMTIDAADVISPVLASPKIVVLFSTGMTTKTGLRDFFRRFVLERNDLLRIAFREVSFARSMTGLTASHFSFPATEFSEVEVGCVGECLELVLVAVFTSIASHVIFITVVCGFGLEELGGL